MYQLFFANNLEKYSLTPRAFVLDKKKCIEHGQSHNRNWNRVPGGLDNIRNGTGTGKVGTGNLHQEAPQRLYALHQRNEAENCLQVHPESVSLNQSDTRKNGKTFMTTNLLTICVN